ncbi:MAG: metabolite traffic protein EboE [Gammaproteobacteria bacterium]|nr:metabolite traffic protein EboE [Gammaproteobacteria bacterium]
MLIDPVRNCHLTYCSNIHPGESWPDVRATLDERLPAVRRQLGWAGPMGVGLRVAAQAAETLRGQAAFDDLKALLAARELYVFTINGFPYGPFHGTRVKEDVYLPDWREPERVRYTLNLADLLAGLLPDMDGLAGSISTVPGAFKARVSDAEHVQQMVRGLSRCVRHLAELERRTGKRIVLALEPEPCCYLETIEETVRFFEEHLFAQEPVAALAKQLGESKAVAEHAMRTYLGVCLDLCHAAVEFEDAGQCASALAGRGIAIHKVQISAGLRFTHVGEQTQALLEPFQDAVYLHQVVARTSDGHITRYTDLDEAFTALPDAAPATEWRVHFHVPIFLDDMGAFSSTQPFIAEMLAHHREKPLSHHLEVETYTWNVLPEQFRNMSVDEAVARELAWTRIRALPAQDAQTQDA